MAVGQQFKDGKHGCRLPACAADARGSRMPHDALSSCLCRPSACPAASGACLRGALAVMQPRGNAWGVVTSLQRQQTDRVPQCQYMHDNISGLPSLQPHSPGFDWGPQECWLF